jgi:hypothetical protein
LEWFSFVFSLYLCHPWLTKLGGGRGSATRDILEIGKFGTAAKEGNMSLIIV